LCQAIERVLPRVARELIGFYLDQAALLGQRTAELHLALGSQRADPGFAPEEFTRFYQDSQFQSMRSLLADVFRLLRDRMDALPEDIRGRAQSLLGRESEILKRFAPVRSRRFKARRIRVHGDYHLGQVLYTGKDFVIIDFEGEPARSFSERRAKCSALRDVAGMLRSFHYASVAAMFRLSESPVPLTMQAMAPWQDLWHHWVCVSFLRRYLELTRGTPIMGDDMDEIATLLDSYLLEKALYELGYELNNRPGWVHIPLEGIEQVLEAARIAA
jgi:maltose alpha-D-glucosyltransferase/alpha-amylase